MSKQDLPPTPPSTLLLPQAASIFSRWLLASLYFGVGAVKLLSCDPSWRDLTPVHWHFANQPIPNPIGGAAFEHIPMGITKAARLGVFLLELMALLIF